MKVSHEILFWFLTVSLLSLVFGYQFNDFTGASYFVIMLLPVMLGTSYTFSEFLVPKLLLNQKYLRFVQYTLYTIIISLNLEMIVITLAYIVISNYRYENLMVSSGDLFGLTITMYFIVLVKSFAKLIKSSYSDKEKLTQLVEEARKNGLSHLNVKSNRKNAQINLADLNYIESMGDYTRFHIEGLAPITSKEKISKIEQELPTDYIRIHRSFIINSAKIQTYTSEKIYMNEQELPIGRKYKKGVQELLRARS